MADILCGNCGQRHGSVGEVRACHSGGVTPSAAAPPDAEPEWAPPLDELLPAPTPGDPILRPAAKWAGPQALGRDLVISPGVDIPESWADVPVFGFDGLSDSASDELGELRARQAERLRSVIEWSVPDGPPDSLSGPVWSHDPELVLARETLDYVVFANAVDARSPGGARFLPVEAALTAGATLGGEADVVLASGTDAWCDGGALLPRLADHPELGGVALVPAASIAVRDLQPLRAAAPTAELAPDQLEAVVHGGGAARIIAPAGSGKTRVLTERARHLIADTGVSPRAVCLVAFNRRAQAEMAERTPDLPGLQVRTLNSLALAILRGAGPFRRSRLVGRSVEVIDEREVRRILAGLVDMPRRLNTDPAASWIDALSMARLGLRDPKEVEAAFGGDIDGFPDVLTRYRSALRERGVVDFDDQIAWAIEILLADPDARAGAQRACRILLVDEFQDLTPAHLLLIRLVAGPAQEVFGVGDDDQTIYGYTGATPDWLIRYDDLFPGAGMHALQVNYRCPPEVVDGAIHLLSYNRKRVAKEIQAGPSRRADGDGLLVRVVADPTTATVGSVLDALEAGFEPPQIAVLTRVNATLAAVQVSLQEKGLPVVTSVDDGFLARSGARAALAWFRLATGGAQRLNGPDLAEAARRPSRGMSARLVEWVSEQRTLRDLRALAGRLKNDRDAMKVEGLADDLEDLLDVDGDAVAVLEAIRTDIGLDSTMDTLDSSRRSVDRSAHGDDLAALTAMACLHPDPAGFEPWLREALRRPGVETGQGIELATIHRVKGREWPIVVVHEASAGLLPHRLAEDLEEERRVFHVGITRSQHRTVVVADHDHPSPFLAELDGSAPHPTERPPPKPSKPKRDGKTAVQPIVHRDEDDPVRIALKAWRSERARTEAKPAYVFFNDRTLDELVDQRPTTLKELGRIHGIGPRKLEDWGDELLSVIDLAQ
ncbi:MAG: ATP-dependent DNA helicase UvrD2 [Actinomycetia bacterium]|nr:ATP-dependent DNA helicase UvrD2 [Actinomycetes bacterium]MCP4086618.1 ATP-dependent DNA helicase UvrD2 [Actinomycetes bacterium]